MARRILLFAFLPVPMGGVATPPISVAGTWVIRLTGGREEFEEVVPDEPNWLILVVDEYNILAMNVI